MIERVKVSELYVGALIRADFLGSKQDDKWYKVFDFNQSGTRVYLAVEGNRGRVLPCDYEVEIYK